jgi:outer membrane protein OmpA-like peptidoglycan-associated protein/predicted  nucleic acid-binding Zn-ribbon protein
MIKGCSVRALVLVSAFGAFALGAGDVAALPGDSVDRTAPFFHLIQDTTGESAASETAHPNAVQGPSFLQLNDALAATRAKVEKLARAAEMARTVGELRQELAKTRTENQQLIGELGRARTEVVERQKAGQSANDRIAELATAADQATAEAARARQELTDMNRRNGELSKSLADTQAELASAKAQLEQADAATATRIKELTQASEQSDAEVVQLRDRLVTTEQRIGPVRAQVAAGARLTDLQPALEAERQETARLRDQLSTAQAELGKAGEARKAAEEERDAARLKAEFLAGRLRADLAEANQKIKAVMAKNGELEAETASLRVAAASAADAAQENMLAVESRIEALDAALEGVAPTVEAEGDNLGAAGERRLITSQAADMDIEVTPGKITADQPASTEASPSEQSNSAAEVTSSRSTQTRSSVAPDQAERRDPKAAAGPEPPADLMVGLSPQAKLQAQRLLEDLNAKVDRRGVMVTVAGESLFQSNSERIDPAAHGMLAKLAELIKLYDERKALIVGHTDAIGDASYNQHLAMRRAQVIKKFFVENFKIEQARLSIEGKGEEQPIASNATPDGRRANRRIEVLFLN